MFLPNNSILVLQNKQYSLGEGLDESRLLPESRL